jgi:hypothetical protein
MDGLTLGTTAFVLEATRLGARLSTAATTRISTHKWAQIAGYEAPVGMLFTRKSVE